MILVPANRSVGPVPYSVFQDKHLPSHAIATEETYALCNLATNIASGMYFYPNW